MTSAVIAQIYTPTDEELNEFRNLRASLDQQKLPSSVCLTDELQAYLRHTAHMVGLIAGLNTKTGQAHWENESAISVSTHGVAGLRESAPSWSRFLSLWSSPNTAKEKQTNQ